MKSEKYEEWFDVAFDRAVTSSSLTTEENKQASWKKVQARLEQVNRKRTRRRRMQLSGIVAASFVAGAILFSPPGVTKAVSPIVKTVVDMGNGVIGIVVRNGEVPSEVVTPKTELPANYNEQGNQDDNYMRKEWSEVNNSVNTPLDQGDLQAKLSFAVPDLSELQNKYHFESYTVSSPTEDRSKYDKVTFKFTDTEQHTVWIYLMKLKTFQSILSTLSKETEVMRMGNDDIYYSPGLHNQLLGIEQNIMINIESDIPKAELVEVYKSVSQSLTQAP
ncbi:hypothetical protein [Paenibacillus chibensis]|uniref:hypothetical protein n=1 Tax=Paenibacillus chibensis TaxID=59846 RepID=UPI000FD8D427|nr:hypothetical protein [Paenibacillus chibensis]MEC0371404.1 hypothetical protein [Paenibacillus chibensis]